jgi:diadenylate cyclase
VPTDRSSAEVKLRQTLAAAAPGTQLRDALERILRGRTGALIVLGDDRSVEGICTGGFLLNVEFTATGLRELAKMDGAIVVDRDCTRIIRAATHLVPDPTIHTAESGTRHRTADRTAKQTGVPVISVSQSMRIVAIYVDGLRYVLEDPSAILARANQALATLERYKLRLDEVAGTLTALEIEDLVTVRDVATVGQRQEMVARIAREIEGYVVELGSDGRLLALQLDELVAGVDTEAELLARDYAPTPVPRRAKASATDLETELSNLDASSLLDLSRVAHVMGFPSSADLDAAVSPRGYRLLARVPRLPATVVDRLVEHFGGLQKLLAAGIDDLQAVEGVGEGRARTVREGLSRLAESSILERYV